MSACLQAAGLAIDCCLLPCPLLATLCHAHCLLPLCTCTISLHAPVPKHRPTRPLALPTPALPGTHLATSGDAGEVLLWEPVDAAAAAARRGNLCEDEGEASWRRCAAFKGHSAGGDVMDLAWAPDGTALASGAIDNEAFLFVAAGRKRGDTAGRFKDHKHFVQVGAWGRVGVGQTEAGRAVAGSAVMCKLRANS